jgi:hypothetical protein
VPCFAPSLPQRSGKGEANCESSHLHNILLSRQWCQRYAVSRTDCPFASVFLFLKLLWIEASLLDTLWLFVIFDLGCQPLSPQVLKFTGRSCYWIAIVCLLHLSIARFSKVNFIATAAAEQTTVDSRCRISPLISLLLEVSASHAATTSTGTQSPGSCSRNCIR